MVALRHASQVKELCQLERKERRETSSIQGTEAVGEKKLNLKTKHHPE